MAFMFDHMCRTCLTNSELLFSIFDKNIPEMNSTAYAVDFLKNFCKIEITRDDNLPDKVCAVCAEEIKRAYAFKIKCERAACTLNKLLQQRADLQSKIISTLTDDISVNIVQPTIATSSSPITYQLKLIRKDVNTKRTESPVPMKKLKKKITEKRPPTEINGISATTDVIYIEDDDEIRRVPIFSDIDPVLAHIPSIEQSVKNINSVNQQSVNADNSVEEDFSDYVTDSPVSVILIMNEDVSYITHKENLQPIASPHKSNSDNIQDTDKVVATSEILNKREPQAVSNTTQDSYICHICSDIIWGDNNFVDHISEHKIGPQKDMNQLPVDVDENNKINQVESINQTMAVSVQEETLSRDLRVCIEDTFVCYICNKAIKGNDSFIGHVLAHRSTTIHETKTESDTKITAVKCADGFRCGECGEICQTKKTLILHVRRRHMSNHTCNICQEVFSTFEKLCNHRRMVHSTDHHCKLCKMKFGSRSKLDNHMKQSHNKESDSTNGNITTIFACHYCFISFGNEFQLKTHLVVCGCKKQPFNCGMCSLSFETDDALNIHIRTHDDD